MTRPPMRATEYVAMFACYALVAGLFWLMRDQVEAWLYFLGVL